MIVAGSVSTHAVAICHTVAGWSPTPDPTIVPEMPPVTTCVVLTGKPLKPATPITAAAANSADPPCAGTSFCLPRRSPSVVDFRALEGDFGQDFADGGAKAGVIVGDDELDAIEAALAQAEKKVLPGRSAFAIGMSTARIWRRPSQSTPMAISTA